MLSKLIVKNVALIEYAEIEFSDGLNVLSGETGSGKSVILDSINFVLGAKAEKSMIRFGEKECCVTAVFIPDPSGPVFDVLREMDIEQDEELIINRKYSADGRGSIKVNGIAVNASMLRQITSHLVDVHGQSEHFYLMSEVNQLALIDKVAGQPLCQAKDELNVLLTENREIRRKLSALGGDDASRGRRLDIIKFQLDEIGKADLREGEEEELASKKLLFANMEKIMRSFGEAAQFLNGDGAALDGLNGARRSLSEISHLNAEYESLCERLDGLVLEAEDISETVSSFAENLSFDEKEAEEVEERLDMIRALKKKYGSSVSDIFRFRDKIAQEYELLSHSDEEFIRLTHLQEKNYSKIFNVCRKMSDLRKQAADRFCGDVVDILKTLNIKNAQFCASFSEFSEESAEHATRDGLDRMSFLFSANAGEPLKPLNKVISGGEMSRLMLAIKTKMSDINQISTYIFDEIDAGISGKTAHIVAERFADIAKHKQILAVSHLAQIVAMADCNFLISKRETSEGKTLTQILPLDADGRMLEIVRLIGGTEKSDAAKSLAEELSENCAKYKNKTA